MVTKVTVDKDVAKAVLSKAYHLAQTKPAIRCMHAEFIDFVLDNTHLSYKYVLVNALLAKATNQNINPLCLQKKSTLSGAYDARTICHEVLVPFEKNELGKALGGSNEPFLNKPCRFTELSKSNAVRAGRDRDILFGLCDNLPTIKTSQDAFTCLVYAIQKLLIKKEEKAELTNISIPTGICKTNITFLYRFINKLLMYNCEGEILTLVVAGLYKQLLSGQANYSVEVHPVNESGASRKEVSDLDIYLNGKLYIPNELKDKVFTDHDIEHAADKVMAVGKSHMNFIVGRHGRCPMEVIHSIKAKYLAQGFIVNIIPVDYFVSTILTMITDVNVEEYLKYILSIARDTKFKETTIALIKSVASQELGVD